MANVGLCSKYFAAIFRRPLRRRRPWAFAYNAYAITSGPAWTICSRFRTVRGFCNCCGSECTFSSIPHTVRCRGSRDARQLAMAAAAAAAGSSRRHHVNANKHSLISGLVRLRLRLATGDKTKMKFRRQQIGRLTGLLYR